MIILFLLTLDLNISHSYMSFFLCLRACVRVWLHMCTSLPWFLFCFCVVYFFISLPHLLSSLVLCVVNFTWLKAKRRSVLTREYVCTRDTESVRTEKGLYMIH